MKQRHTIVLDSELVTKIRKIQARQIRKTGRAASFSAVINRLLKESLS